MAKPVFDHYSRGTPPILTESVRDVMLKSLETCGHIGEMFEAMQDEQIRCIREDPSFQTRLRDAYHEAGVNLVSPTMGAVGLRDVDNASYPTHVKRDLARWQAHFDHLDWMKKVLEPEDVRDLRDDEVGIIINTQNLARLIEDDLAEIDTLYNYGMRLMQLTYNAQTLLGAGCTERNDGGVSSLGLQVIQRLNDQDIIIDLAHCGTQTTLDTIHESEDPVMFSHSSCQAVADHPYGKSDAELQALAANDGYMGIICLPASFLVHDGAEDGFEAFFDHLEHAIDVLGIDRVGIGSDFGSWNFAGRPDTPDEIKTGIEDAFRTVGVKSRDSYIEVEEWGLGPIQEYTDWHHIPRELRNRGYSDDAVDKITGGNFLSFWDRVCQ